MTKEHHPQNPHKITPADFIPEKFLKLVLRFSKYRPDLLHAYWGPADLKNTINQEPKCPLEELLEQCKDLRREVKRKMIDLNRTNLYLERLQSLEVLIQDRLGRQYGHLEFVENVYGIKVNKDSEEKLKFLKDRLKRLLEKAGYGQDLVTAVNLWREKTLLEGNKIIRVFKDEIEKAKVLTQKLLELPRDEGVTIKGVKNIPWRMFTRSKEPRQTTIEINLDYKISVFDLEVLAAHEYYPGHHTEMAIKESHQWEKGKVLEGSYSLLHSPTIVINEGVGENAHYFLFSQLPEIDRDKSCPS